MVPPAPAGEECVDVTYTYDVNSILEVIVKVISTNVEKRLVIKNEETDLTDEEIDARFEELSSEDSSTGTGGKQIIAASCGSHV